MTKENAKGLIPLVQALAEGKTIQYFYGDSWIDQNNPLFDDEARKYRIKPDELWYVVQSQNGYEIKCSSEFETDPCREFESSDKSECEKWIEEHTPNYVPFESVDELIECWNQKKYNGKPTYETKLNMPLIWVMSKESKSKLLITGYASDNWICTSEENLTLKELFNRFTFIDGSPIGKIKE